MVLQNFHFVNGASVSSREKREIRRHVMMGKNAGKTIHRPSRVRERKQRPLNEQKKDMNLTRETKTRTKSTSPGIDPRSQVSTEVRSMAFPVAITTQYVEIITDCKMI
jgi:hypothetical protein